MAVYVDKSKNKYGRMIMCHMLADSIDELHVMAGKIGIQRKWFQNKKSAPHYDICQSKRALAVGCGAIEINGRELVALLRELRKKNV